MKAWGQNFEWWELVCNDPILRGTDLGELQGDYYHIALGKSESILKTVAGRKIALVVDGILIPGECTLSEETYGNPASHRIISTPLFTAKVFDAIRKNPMPFPLTEKK